jgi:DNA/RNA-binding domain of Phe-tRNA-synthetase-like protein
MFSIDNEISQKCPTLRFIVVYAKNVNVQGNGQAVKQFENEVCLDLQNNWQYANAQSHPYIQAWRGFFKEIGLSVKKYQSSVELLTKRVIAGKGLYEINPLVNFYNALSMRHSVSLGAWDIDALSGNRLRLGYSKGGEPFYEMGSSDAVSLGENEITYFDEKDVITRHFVWRQSEKGLVTPDSKNIFMVSEILDCVSSQTIEQIMQTLREKLVQWFDADVQVELIDSQTSVWTPSNV